MVFIPFSPDLSYGKDFDPVKCSEYTLQNKKRCLKLAEKGNPSAQAWMGIYYEHKIQKPFSAFLDWQDKHKKNPELPDENLDAALMWFYKAALSNLRENKPYKALRIAKKMLNDNPFNPLSFHKESKKSGEEILQKLQNLKIDRKKLADELLTTNDQAYQLSILQKLILPFSDNHSAPSDFSGYKLNSIVEIKNNDKSFIVVTGGNGIGGFCGTGIANGGMSTPLIKGNGVNFVMVFARDGILLAQAEKSRNNLFVMDADNDGIKNELVIFRNYFNYNQPPYLAIYDLSKRSIPEMISFTFNSDAKNRMIRKKNADGSITVSLTMKKTPIINGEWQFKNNPATHFNNIVILNKNNKSESDIKYNSQERNWKIKKNNLSDFWKQGLIKVDSPIIRFNQKEEKRDE
jgi:hypothetical protein